MSLKLFFKQTIAALLFTIFGFICILGNLIFIPIVILRLNKFKVVENLSRDIVCVSWKIFIQILRLFGYMNYTFEISTPLNKSSQLIVANHPSLLDVVFLISKIRRANCVVKGSLDKNPFLFAAIKACNYISNTKNEELLDKSIKALKSGQALIVFPEGTRTKGEITFHKAASHIAIKAASEVVGIAINMHPRSLAKDQPWYKTPDVMIKYEFKELFCLDVSGFLPHKSSALRVRQLHEHISEIYKKEFKDAKFD
ncbi:lysophospholipid acyltransferase family protein [Campylobacter sp.]|uniref:lysophospholipid acyltransferase family protein n=1 Tax=Campylobacter sp. TaxID=205 RepID=UPI002702D4DE|nr:lysophospholipid acyltransferase family protein [Campylobacter sp.]